MKKLLTSFTAICAAIFIAVCVSQSGRCAETEQTHKIAGPFYDAQKDYAVWGTVFILGTIRKTAFRRIMCSL